MTSDKRFAFPRVEAPVPPASTLLFSMYFSSSQSNCKGPLRSLRALADWIRDDHLHMIKRPPSHEENNESKAVPLKIRKCKRSL